MASIVETKSVAIRKGNHNENVAFTGVLGEVTADLGYEDKSGNLGTDSNTTLRLHNGVTKGGVPMARADMLNVSTELLAQGRESINDKNLAYSDLSNIVLPENSSARNRIKSIMETCGLADENDVADRLEMKADADTSNINTANLTSSIIHDGVEEGDYPLAYASTKNINTLDLATTQYHNDSTNGNLPLSYANMSNVDTTNITKSTSERTSERLDITGPVIAKADFSNTDTTNLTLSSQNRPSNMSGPMLARADLANVDPSAFSVDTFGLEKTANKKGVINPSDTNQNDYPNVPAVISYVEGKVSNIEGNYANTFLSNIESWDMLYGTSTSPIMKRSATVDSSNEGFKVGDSCETDVYLKDDEKDILWVKITSVASGGGIQSNGISFHGNVGNLDLTSYNPFKIESPAQGGTDAVFTITSNPDGSGSYSYTIESISNPGSGFSIDDECVIKSNATSEEFKIVYKTLKVVVKNIEVTDSTANSGRMTEIECDPAYGITSVTASSVTATSKTNATATVSITSSMSNENGQAGLAKVDFTNLRGMTANDQTAERNAPWRIRHNEAIPSVSQGSISADQYYTIATNGNVWDALRQLDVSSILANVPSVMFKAQFVSNTSYSTQSNLFMFDTSYTSCVINEYGKDNSDKFTMYTLLPNHTYNIQIFNQQVGGEVNNYTFTTGNAGTSKTFEYSLANVTFNVNVQTATLTIESQGMTTKIHNITTGTYTAMITNDSTWTISSSGYTDETGSLTVASGDQTVNVTLQQS